MFPSMALYVVRFINIGNLITLIPVLFVESLGFSPARKKHGHAGEDRSGERMAAGKCVKRGTVLKDNAATHINRRF